MKILMDTHAFLWFVEGDKRLSALARETIANPSNDLYLSLGSICELSIKVAKGKLALNPPLDSFIQQWVFAYGLNSAFAVYAAALTSNLSICGSFIRLDFRS